MLLGCVILMRFGVQKHVAKHARSFPIWGLCNQRLNRQSHIRGGHFPGSMDKNLPMEVTVWRDLVQVLRSV